MCVKTGGGRVDSMNHIVSFTQRIFKNDYYDLAQEPYLEPVVIEFQIILVKSCYIHSLSAFDLKVDYFRIQVLSMGFALWHINCSVYIIDPPRFFKIFRNMLIPFGFCFYIPNSVSSLCPDVMIIKPIIIIPDKMQ